MESADKSFASADAVSQATPTLMESVPQGALSNESFTNEEEPAQFKRLISLTRKTAGDYFASGQGEPITVRWRNNRPYYFGQGEARLHFVANNLAGVSALSRLDATGVVEAYMADDIDIRGDMMILLAFRNMTSDNHPLRYLWTFLHPFLFGQAKTDRKSIQGHYDYTQEFYLAWLDSRHRCYSQAIFANDDENLEDAQTRKFAFALDQVGAKPGMNVLDIGGGWGSMTEFAAKRGINVTSLTISKESEDFINALIKREGLKTAKVVNCHLYEYEPGFQFDAIVNLGVTEHLPDYARSLKTYERLLKPGAKIYLDASACKEKYKFHSFIYRYIYPYNCSPLCLHDYVTQISKSPMQLLGLWDDRQNYYLTAKHWALNLEKNREQIVAICGEMMFRKFQVYLWGTADVFQRDIMQAWRWVMRKPE